MTVRSGKLSLLSIISLLGGLWMIICPFAIGASTGARWDGVIFGVLVAIFAIGRLASPAARALSWVNFAFGIWLLISPWVLGFPGSGIRWNDTITGLIILICSGLAATDKGMVATAGGETGFRKVA